MVEDHWPHMVQRLVSFPVSKFYPILPISLLFSFCGPLSVFPPFYRVSCASHSVCGRTEQSTLLFDFSPLLFLPSYLFLSSLTALLEVARCWITLGGTGVARLMSGRKRNCCVTQRRTRQSFPVLFTKQSRPLVLSQLFSIGNCQVTTDIQSTGVHHFPTKCTLILQKIVNHPTTFFSKLMMIINAQYLQIKLTQQW